MKSRRFVAVLVFAISVTAQTDRKFIKSKVATERHLPFSSGVLADHTLYVAGTTADAAQLAAGIAPEEEAKVVMEQIKQTLQSAGMGMDDVVSVQVFCTDLALYDAFNRVYSGYFRGNFPARAFIGVSKLLFGAHYEVAAVASKK